MVVCLMIGSSQQILLADWYNSSKKTSRLWMWLTGLVELQIAVWLRLPKHDLVYVTTWSPPKIRVEEHRRRKPLP